jgi:hypothetical protein
MTFSLEGKLYIYTKIYRSNSIMETIGETFCGQFMIKSKKLGQKEHMNKALC